MSGRPYKVDAKNGYVVLTLQPDQALSTAMVLKGGEPVWRFISDLLDAQAILADHRAEINGEIDAVGEDRLHEQRVPNPERVDEHGTPYSEPRVASQFDRDEVDA